MRDAVLSGTQTVSCACTLPQTAVGRARGGGCCGGWLQLAGGCSSIRLLKHLLTRAARGRSALMAGSAYVTSTPRQKAIASTNTTCTLAGSSCPRTSAKGYSRGNGGGHGDEGGKGQGLAACRPRMQYGGGSNTPLQCMCTAAAHMQQAQRHKHHTPLQPHSTQQHRAHTHAP